MSSIGNVEYCPFCGQSAYVAPAVGGFRETAAHVSHCGLTVESTMNPTDTVAAVKRWNLIAKTLRLVNELTAL